MPRSSTLLFAITLCLSFALVVWWTAFQLMASRDLRVAGELLVAGDVDAAARALGAADRGGLAEVARRRQWMFASEGGFFAVVLLAIGGLYFASLRRETALRASHDRFLAAATHELKTPLATITLLLESLRDDRVPADKRARHLASGLLEAARLERGLHNVLTAAGLRTTAPRMRREPGDLAADVRVAVEALRARALAADIHIEVDAAAAVPATRDPAALQLALGNLIDNGIKFSPPGSTVHVELDADDATAWITVRDAGRGLDADECAHVFEPFWRGSDSASGGTGLGLHLVQQLVQAHGGAVSASSAGRGRGASFRVQLPRGERR